MKSRFMSAAALSSALVLSACGGGTTDADTDGDGEVSGAEMEAAMESVSGQIKPNPGKYRATMELIEVDMPGAPAQVQEMMGSMMNQTSEFCLTPEQAEAGFEESLSEGQQEGCKVSKFQHSGSNVDMAMSCEGSDMGNIEMTMTGEVAPERSDMQMTMNGNVPGMGDMSMKMNFAQERIGDCDE